MKGRKFIRSRLLAAVAMSVLSLCAGATETNHSISGNLSNVDGACNDPLLAAAGINCVYDGGITPINQDIWQGPFIGGRYYEVGQSPFALAGDTTGRPGDPGLVLYEVPLIPGTQADPTGSLVTIEDNGTPCDADDTISARLVLGAATRFFPFGPGEFGEETWADGARALTIPAIRVDSATAGGGGCVYEIANKGFPPLLDVQTPPPAKYPAPREGLGTYVDPTNGGQVAALDVFCGTLGMGYEDVPDSGNCGITGSPKGTFGGLPLDPILDDPFEWSCRDNSNPAIDPAQGPVGGPGTCGNDYPLHGACEMGIHGGEHSCGRFADLENILVRVEFDANGDLVDGLIYMHSETRFLNPPIPQGLTSWNGPVVRFAGTDVTPPPTTTTVPDVIGLNRFAAEDAIVASDLVVGTVTEINDPAPAGVVIGQNPQGGDEVDLGSAVDLTVSLGPPPQPPTVAEQIQALKDAVIALGLKNGLTNALCAKLINALNKVTDGNPNNDAAAVGSLQAFINQVQANSGKGIDPADAAALIAAAEAIIAQI